MSRFSWFEVTVLAPTGHAMTFTEYAADEREALANFRSRGPRSKKAQLVRVVIQTIQDSPEWDKQPSLECAPA